MTTGQRSTRDGERDGRSLTCGPDGEIEAIQQSGRSAAQLVLDYRRPADGIQSVLDRLLLPEDEVADGTG